MYNVQGYIGRCLHSILGQDYNDYEIILVDDESTDGTLVEARQIIEQYQDRHNITLIKKKNSGASDTRNVGLKRANGEFVIFMDADDQMTSEALIIMDEATRKKEADLYVFSLKKEIEGRIVESRLSKVNKFYLEAENPVRCLELYLEKTNHIITWQPWSKVFRKCIIEQNDVSFDTSLYCCNDFNFFMKYFLCVKSVLFTNIPTTIYSIDRPGSISGTKLQKRFESSTRAYSDMYNRISGSGYNCPILLDYMSYLFLCTFDLVPQMTDNQMQIVKDTINDNYEVYYYSQNIISRLRRILFRYFGVRKGAQIIDRIRYLSGYLKKGNSDI